MAVLLSVFLYGIAVLYTQTEWYPGPHGRLYAQLSINPWDFNLKNECRFRIFAPIIGYFTGLRGNLFMGVPLIFSLLFFTFLYLYLRKNETPVKMAVLFTSLLGLSTLRFIPIFAPYYVDSVYLFWLLLTFVFARNALVRNLCFTLAIFTHESSLFLLLPLILYSFHKTEEKSPATLIRIAAGLGLGVCLLFSFRLWVTQHAEVAYSSDFYLNWENIQNTLKATRQMAPLGIFYSFKFAWLGVFYALYLSFKNKDYLWFTCVISILICTFLQLLIAYDTGRLMNLAFPALILSFFYLKDKIPATVLCEIMSLMLLLNLLCAQYYVVQWEVVDICRG